MEWHYDKGYVDVSMPDYVKKVLKKFQHPTPLQPQFSPHAWNRPTFGARIQYATKPDSSPLLDKRTRDIFNRWSDCFLNMDAR